LENRALKLDPWGKLNTPVCASVQVKAPYVCREIKLCVTATSIFLSLWCVLDYGDCERLIRKYPSYSNNSS
jgi:hypothetical protein